MKLCLRTFSLGLLAFGSFAACGDGGDDDDFEGVRINARDVYQTSGGETVAPSVETGRQTIAVHSNATTYPGAMGPEGEIRVSGVPEGPYLLELTPPPATPGGRTRRSFYEFTARDVDVSRLHSFRPDLQAMNQSTYITVKAPLTRPWQAGAFDEQGDEPAIALDDSLYVYSRNAFVVGAASGGESAFPAPGPGDGTPTGGETVLAWRLDVKAMVESLYGSTADVEHLVDAGKGDDFTVLHVVAKPARTPGPPPAGGGEDPFRAYSYNTLEEALSPPPFTMVDGGASTIEGAFVALPQKTFALDYKGAAFNDLLRDFSTQAFSGVILSFSVRHEPGAPEPADGAFGPLLDFAVFPRPAYVDKVCNPENEDDEGQRVCDDAAACPAGCNDQKALTLPGDHAREYAYGNPFAGGQELASVNYSFRANFGEGVTSSTGPNQLRGGFFVIAPAAELNGAPLAPVVGLARNVTFNGQPAPVGALTPGVGLTPAIAFEPPTLGTPSSYRVIVNQVVLDRSNAGTEFAYGVSIANVTLDGTALTLPAGILEAGTTYYLQVEARVREPLPSKSPFRTGPHFASSTTFTGAFTP